MPPEASAGEDTRVWIGRVASGHEADHARFINWLKSDEAESIFRRRRLTEYLLFERAGSITVIFKAPHTGDPRIMIDFLRYPGIWPDYWEFERSGRAEEVPDPLSSAQVKVHWRRVADQTE